MLQPRRNLVLLVLVLVVCLDCLRGDEQNEHRRRKRQSDKDVTTVLLVDSHGRSSLGRYQNVKPNIGLITSTARTFVQDGVATEYATQVLGTTLDNGRVYAHLLSKSSRVLYDKAPNNKQWNVKDEYPKNVDHIVPNKAGAVYVFPTRMQYYSSVDNNRQEVTVGQDSVEEEILKQEPSNNFRSAYVDPGNVQNNVKVFKISPQVKDLTYENIINHKETTDPPLKNQFTPSKVKPWDNVPTFTVRNEFSPSGLSYLGDLPDFEERTERSKLTTPAERKAKLLFRAGLAKPNPKDLKSITYTGFADFTTTVGDTVIFFTPHTSDVKKPQAAAETTKISVEATIKPTSVFQEPEMTKAVLPQKPVIEPKNKGPIEMKTLLPSMVIDKTDRIRDSKTVIDEHIDMEAKSAVLAHEQGKETTINRFTPDVIQPSETQPVLLSTPSDEDIAKIFASLQAQAMQVTQPLQLAPKEETKEPSLTGATTIFFDDDLPIETSAVEATGATTASEPTTEKEATVAQETTEKQITTTEEILTTSDNIISTFPIQQTTPETKESEDEDDEQDDEEADVTCTRVLLPTTIYKTLTYLTTFYIPIEGGTSTSIRSNEVINTETGYETKPCGYLSPTKATSEVKIPPSVLQQPAETEKTSNVETTTLEQQTTTEEEVTEQRVTTVAQEVTTEEHQVAESEPETTEATTDEGEEVELIFKTLYTTYTYLTTYFQDTTSSIASRIVVTTNVITSTLDPNREITDEAVAGLMGKVESPVSKTVSFDDLAGINPSNVESVVPTRSVDSDDTEDVEESEDTDVSKPTPTLDDKKLLQTGAEGLKTYYTTYTYFTTIFVDGETEISSRTEVYTNYVTPSQVAPGDKEIVPTKVPDADRKEKILKLDAYNTINRQKNADSNEILSTPSSKEQDYVTLQRGTTTTEDNEIEDENSILDLSEYETISTMVTDVRSSTSAGDRRIIDNLDKRNVLLDDQIVSESNNESEIIPSPTLLLQTSYTTFTYFTTMYHGTTSSDIVSRLETITNVVTQTLSPTQRITPEDVSLPVTYFTTFTYWTTLYKDGTTKVTSREETVSNVVTPTIEATSVAPPIVATEVPEIPSTKAVDEAIVPSTVGDDDLTTYFTTYTYYTTSYIGDKTVLNSRLETVTNVLNNSDIATNQIGRSIKLPTVNRIEDALEKPKPINAINASSVVKPTGLLSTIVNTVENNGTTTLLSTDVYGTYIDGLYAKVLESTSNILTPNITPSAVVTESLYPTGVVSINQGKIVDAEGVSTLLYTTKALGTYIDNVYTTVTESSSSLAVDEEKKAALPTDLPIAHRTGLVRLIEGSIIANDTTTFYESKVLGTVIDGRYAQIIESTSSFLSGPKASVSPNGVNDISPSATVAPDGQIASTATISPSPVAIEGSISDTVKDDAENSTEEGEEDDEKDGGRSKSRLTFQSRKRTFTPAIRPFASRQRPTFAPKRKQSGQSTAATITRSDFTPTVTAVPASRPNRFGARRSSTTPAGIQPTASGGRRFSRPKSSSAGGRRASSARIQPTSSGFGGSSRRAGFRTSSAGGPGIRPSSLFPARPRIRPTASLGLNRATSSQVTQPSVDEQNDLTTVVTDEVDTSVDDSETTLTLQTTTEATSRRSQNPLLKFRRPPLRPTSATRTRTTTKKPASTTTTSARPRVTRPPSSLINRPRPNALFPRRGLFTTTTQAPPPEEEVEVVEEGENEEDLEEEGDAEEDTDYDSSLTNTQTAKPPQKPKPGVSIRPFARRRSRRDTYSRFKRPTGRTTTAAPLEEREEITEAPRFSSRGRFYPKRGNYKSSSTTTTTSAPAQSGRKRISPSKPLSQGRTQFTLRNSKEKLSMTTKRTNTRNGGRPTTSSRQKTARGRYQTENTNNRGRQTSRTTNRGRGTQRQRYNKEDIDTNFSLPKFDGTITVTHHVPTEVTIPVVNGKVTEYKNVVSAKYSTEVLDKSQYTTSINPLGKEVKVLVSEKSELDGNGATLITQFVLNETPTTTVLYTPTVINRRKTSFSHVVPSTKYDVEEVVTTIQPALAAQAPLANILLSQLLLGGLAPQPNALLGIPPGGYVAPTPTTELKTKTTTYVTTVTNEMSTVIPLTFRGKEILTTLISSSVSVITATEYLTETVTVTPAFPVAPQFNTALLLPLLQQQLQQQQQQNQQLSASQLLQAQQPADVFSLNTEPIQQQSLEENENLALEESQELVEQQATEGPKRRPTKSNKKNKQAPVEPPKETSVVTLYVSGRTPGEFTTLLSTVTVGEDEKRSKREVPVTPSQLPSQLSVEGLDDYIMPASEVHLEASELTKETESLESIIGDVSKHITTQTPELFNIKPTKSAKASKKYKIKYVKASDSKKAASDAFLETKRDVSEPTRRRVVKKLIGVRPVQNASTALFDTNNDLDSNNARRVPRRRLKIKKKKKRLLSNNGTLSDDLQHPYKLSDKNFDEEHVQQATKPRRKVVITRKRILPNSSKLSSFVMASEPQVTSINATPTIEVQQSTTEPSNEEKDVTEENLVESAETTTIGDDENSTEEAEYDDEYYDDDEDSVTEETTEVVTEETTDVTEENLIASTEDYFDDADEKPTFQNIPEYEPSFPELTESLDSPLLPLKTTVLSSVDLLTSTVTESRLRTYTFVVTRVSGTEQIITSTTEVRPQVKTTVLTEPVTKYTTLTLLDLDDRTDILSSTLDIPPSLLLDQENTGNAFSEEARYNLATRVMSNGVEVIVAGDKTTLPGDDAKRILPSSQVPITLKPSTLTDRMVLMMPQETTNPSESTPLLYNDQFITKTCLTTFTYLTTYLEGSKTVVSSHEQVVSNIATEERNTGKILPTPAVGITLTQYPNLSVGLFRTTYTYLNTILDGEQPLVVSSKHTVTNTVTAPDDYLSFLKPSETSTPLKDTNTYYSTINLEKTLYEGNKSSVISTRELVTQVIITESVPPRATSVMTSYIALDDAVSSPYSTTDVVKTYFVTYTYYNTLVDQNGNEVVHKNISTSSDVVTEKIYLQPKKQTDSVINTDPITAEEKKKQKVDSTSENFKILATKSYFTTFTYFTTLLQDNQLSPTVVSSRTKVVENVVTETIQPSLVKENYLTDIKNNIRNGSRSVIRLIELQDGQKLEVTAISDKITPTKVMHIEKTKTPEITQQSEKATLEPSSSSNVITGSTIVFVDDDPFAQFAATPSLSIKSNVASTVVTNLGSSLSSEVVKKTKVSTSKSKRNKNKTKPPSIAPTKIKNAIENTESDKVKHQLDKKDKTKQPTPDKAEPVSDLLGLGSININSLQALTPVLNAMAGLITTNLKTTNRRSDNITIPPPSSTTRKPQVIPNVEKDDTQNRSPIYIPVGGLSDDFEIAESQNIATFDWVDPPGKGLLPGKATQEASLLDGAIPISPGDVITANSDVIVGKPGRVGPRIPSIPLNQLRQDEDIPLDMKPPPAPNKPWPKKNYLQDSAPVGSVHTNVIHVPNKDDYVGPPPPPPVSKDKRKHIPLTPPKKDADSYYEKTFSQRPQVYANSQTNYEPNHAINEINHEHNHFNLQESIHKNYHSVQSYPVYAQSHATPLLEPGPPMKDFNIQPLVINEPIVLPEVIERSTGQPLLVNIQPSQVAFVNIPFNRTTALIYGGSTEPHRNGQYFDDPSPYPDSGFSDTAYNKNVPQVNSAAYEHPSADQKRVNGVIKVGNQLINVEPDVSENQKVLVNIQPSKPQYNEVRPPPMKHDHEVNVNVPPISFGLVQQGNEFHAHVINHNSDIEFRPPPQPYEVVNPQINHPNNKHPQTDPHPFQPLSNEILSQPQHEEQRPPPRSPVAKPDDVFNKGNFINKPKYPFPPKRNIFRLKPQRPDNVDIKDYMTPPPYIHSTLPKRPPARRPAGQRPQPIPLGVGPAYTESQKPNYYHHTIPSPGTQENKIVIDGPGYQIYNKKPTEHQYIPSFSEDDMDIGDHEEDDLPNEDGEVIQESNSRPLLPGEVPLEILKAKATTTERPRNNSVRFPSDDKDRFHVRPSRPDQSTTQHNRINVIDTDINALRTSTERVRPGGFIVVGNQFEGNDGPNQIVVSGSQFNDKNPYNNQVRTSTEKTTTQEYHRFSESTYGNVFGFKTRTTPVTTSSPITTRKPVLIFLDDTGKQSNNFLNKNHERPSVTSLPIDVQVAMTHKNHSKTLETQTEKPFIPQQNPSLSSNQIVIKDESTTTTTISTTPDLNTGEVTVSFGNVSKEISDMEIMKPPPLVTDLPVKPLSPKPSRLPEKNYAPTKPPTHPLEELVPPPPTTTEEVLGMSPPPLVTTYRPPLKPVFPVQTNISKDTFQKPSTTITTTTERHRHTRPTRRPFTRRPTGFRTTTTLVPITTRRRPSYPGYDILKRNLTTPRPLISPSPTVQSKPSLQVIIGNPVLDTENKSVAATTRPTVELAGSEASTKEQTTERTASLSEATDLLPSGSGSILPSTSIKEDIITQAVHHAGNEVKVVDETPSISTKVIPPSSKLPTRYITYTKTATVTITKTTVVRTSGLPPSTLTILVTKTEKSTIVDTVTEVRTLVKPTSIVETITTTVHQASSLYPPDMYGSPYPSIQVKPSTMKPIAEVSATRVNTPNKEESLEDFIITDDVKQQDGKKEDLGQDSILVVLTDKNTKNIVRVPNETVEIQSSEEVEDNSVENNLLLGGILIGNRPRSDKCVPECKPARNELCQKLGGSMRCVCRPGFARMFLDRPCLPTYTYDIQLTLDRMGKDPLHFSEELRNVNSSRFVRYARPIREALDRMVMQSDLRDIFHGVEVHALMPSNHSKGIVTRFYLQLSDNMDETRLEDVFRKYLRNNSYSLGGTDVFASSPVDLKAHDFDECAHPKFHDCSENAKCFNLKGTYTCSCKEGYADMSENMLYPGRVCSAEVVGCERCSYHGTCYSRGHDDVICECFQWYTGDSCHVNLKVLLIALATLGVLLLILFLVCIIMSCVKRKPSKMAVASGLSFLPQRVTTSSNRGTIDRRAMIQDTSSEDSRSETNTLPYVQNKKKPKGALKKTSKASAPSKEDNLESTISFADQKDRSLTVMIPRAKYHPPPPTSPILNYTSFDARKPSVPSTTNESKLISYLDAGPSPGKTDQARKASAAPTETIMEEKPGSRKTSGALVSAGFEVSATVVNNMGTLGTTCGTEADRSENATLIQKISADLLSSADTRSQFNTLRQSLVEDDESSSNWLDIVPRVMTVSEVRSYDETTIPPPMKSFRTDYESKLSSHQNDEANTMAERDLGSTFLLPHTHLYKPDRGSDISGFESL